VDKQDNDMKFENLFEIGNQGEMKSIKDDKKYFESNTNYSNMVYG